MSASAPETTTETTPETTPRKGFRLDLKTVGPLVALALLVILGISLNENFLTYNNITNVLARSSFIGIIAIGATFVITSGGLDLSVGSMAAVIAGVMIIVMNALIPSMGIGWHRVTAFFNLYFKRNADGAVSLGPAKPMLIDGEPADFETADPETQPFGVVYGISSART